MTDYLGGVDVNSCTYIVALYFIAQISDTVDLFLISLTLYQIVWTYYKAKYKTKFRVQMNLIIKII